MQKSVMELHKVGIDIHELEPEEGFEGRSQMLKMLSNAYR